MTEKSEEKIPCDVCRALVPKAAALHAEGEGYVAHFCAPSCLAFWKESHSEEDKSPR